ncbi:Cyclin-dependent kinases regulatory subunit 1 [Monoraphidium neglectum]|uniref:Cyclin-dependent kinases regulatory subunit n=1 Tax=Monoraphidium neglectum TaxID=145388 RepID=A0A0D2MN78_9CHLO|nr:Cyclin-dependent kinases regulatory subunit 1 [Monoraphidium neglectum]KIY96180.1 Cyclin-dependent kinases regulatory subunit 1 [Monoraphidium neglectum]|eukprot:XP_013895200.1 Cyclin-dependent kinases regulatory subunit 1 [Monoraphidium neglectum]
MAQHSIQYSEKYYDDVYEYRRGLRRCRAVEKALHELLMVSRSRATLNGPWHVVLPPEIANHLPKNRLLEENEWRALGVQQSRGWVHYAVHRPEPHIMLFRRPKGYGQPQMNVQQPHQALVGAQ